MKPSINIIDVSCFKTRLASFLNVHFMSSLPTITALLPFSLKRISSSLLFWLLTCFSIVIVTSGQPSSSSSPPHPPSDADTVLSDIQQCYDSPADLFQVYPQMNATFKIKIKNKCLQLPSLEIYLYVLDESIIDQIYIKEVDQLDPTKLNSIKINRPVMLIDSNDLTNFHPPNASFRLAIVFFDHTGVVDIALHPKVFHFFMNHPESSNFEIFLIILLGVLLLITCMLLALLIYINYCSNHSLEQNGLFFWRKKSSHKLLKVHLLKDQENGIETVTFESKSNVIQVDKIITMIPELLSEERIKLEYDSVPKSKLNSWNDGRLPQHKTKNRYGNLLPYDHTRVILKEHQPDETNYINANFIDGYRRSNRYIAMQGPIDTTIEDFWRCVWQYRCQQIVMLTNLEESGRMKCEKYWPDLSQFYGRIKVTLQNSELFADYIIRTFLCEKENSQMVVVQYHFVSWPDHNVPMYACTLLSFINRIRHSSFYKETSHIIVHCSAGIGRTGAFILIDSMLEMAKKEKKIDVLGHFCRMRLQRINMVEKFSQYVFVYHVLVEALSHESSNITCQEFESYLEQMTKGGHHKNRPNRLQKQFDILNVMSLKKLPTQVCKFGLINCKLNRRPDVIPPDYARVILPNHEDYINAVYINGYRKQDAYIVTQIPFENNRQQFWKMIESTKSSCIILLDSGDVCLEDHIYWPTVVNKKFDFDNEMAVILLKEETIQLSSRQQATTSTTTKTTPPSTSSSSNTSASNNMIVRTFQIRPTDLIVRQFHLNNIHVGSSCLYTNNNSNHNSHNNDHHGSTSNDLIELREKLDQYISSNCNSMRINSSSNSSSSHNHSYQHHQYNHHHPMVVQCIDGVQLSGIFCAADFIFERIKEEQQIDVFLAVQKIRANRPQFIINYDQYLYLHRVALAYLQSFDQYANFK